jgi:hypothetical protein
MGSASGLTFGATDWLPRAAPGIREGAENVDARWGSSAASSSGLIG